MNARSIALDTLDRAALVRAAVTNPGVAVAAIAARLTAATIRGKFAPIGDPATLATAAVTLIAAGNAAEGFTKPTKYAARIPGVDWEFAAKALAGVATGQRGAEFSAGRDLTARLAKVGVTVGPR